MDASFYKDEDESSIDHILLHYAKTKVFWQLLFSLFSVP